MSSNEPPVVVIGGGLTGMAVAMMLAKRDVPVVVVEQDRAEAFGRAEKYQRLRLGAAHANRPHNLRAGGRDVLRRSLPEVMRAVYALGARDAVEWPGSPAADHLTVLVLRRSLLERALLDRAADLPALRLRFGERVRDLWVTGNRIGGVLTTAGPLPARLVIDAGGIRSQILGRCGPPRLSLRSRLYFTSQPFELTEPGFANTEGAAAVWIEPPSEAVSHVRLFLHDRPYATVLVAMHATNTPPSRDLIDESYRAVLSRDDLRRYLDGATPLAPIQSIGLLRSRLGRLDLQPPTAPNGIHQIGDALMAINPLTSKGATLGLIQAEALAIAIAADIDDHGGQRDALLSAYHDFIVPAWADSLLRGSYQRPEPDLPDEITEQIDLARRRGRKAQAIAALAQRDPRAHWEQAELAARVSQLQVPASAMDVIQ
jgi:2-polyprenyl-6-methoxyphenol hydroxylase-like FAD-dependent oxidoreductase